VLWGVARRSDNGTHMGLDSYTQSTLQTGTPDQHGLHTQGQFSLGSALLGLWPLPDLFACSSPLVVLLLFLGVQWTVYRGVAYDLTSFIDRHPAGNWLINLGVGRDCTALFESYHLRPEVAVAHLKRLPVLEGFPVDAVPR